MTSVRGKIEKRWLESLAELGSRLSGAITRDQAVTAVVAGAREATGADRAAYVEARGGRLSMSREQCLGGLIADYVKEAGVPVESPAAEAAASGRIVHLSSPREIRDRFGAIADLAEAGGLCAISDLPVSIGGRIDGVIHLGFDRERALAPGEDKFLLALSSLAAQSIERGEAIDRESRVAIALQVADSVERVAELIYAEGRTLLGADRAALHLVDPNTGDLVLAGLPAGRVALDRIPLGTTSASAEAAWSGKPVVVSSASEYAARYPEVAAGLAEDAIPPAILSIPLRYRGDAIGAIGFTAPSPRHFSERDVALAQVLSDSAAAALERLRLHEAEELAVARQAAIARIARGALEAVSEATLAEIVLEEVAHVEGAMAAAVYMLDRDGDQAGLLALYGWTEEARNQFDHVSMASESALTETIRTGAAVYVGDAGEYERRWPDLAGRYRSEGFEGTAVVPLAATGRTIGAISIAWDAPRIFTTEERTGLEGMAAATAQGFERLRAQQAERRSLHLLEAIVAQMPVGVRVMALDGTIIAGNPLAAAVWHGSEEARTLADYAAWPMFHQDGRPYELPERPAFRALQGETVVDEETFIGRFDGTRGVLSISAAPIRDPGGRIMAGVVVTADITDRKDREASRDAFMAVLSHELRTPMTSIAAATRLLQIRAGDLDAETVTGLYDDIAAETGRLNRIVENLMVLSRIELATMLPTGEPIKLDRLLPRVVQAEQGLWTESRFDLECDRSLPVARGDPGYLDQVMRNLLSNAAKYAPGRIEVAVRREPNAQEVLISVRDHGPGVAAEEAGHIFELFWRSPGQSGRAPGAGVGLFVVRKLVEAMDGRVWLDPSVLDGARFVVALKVVSNVAEPSSD